MRALEFCVNLSLLIFFDHFDEPEVTGKLREILRAVMKNVLFIDSAPFGLKRLERWGRELVLRAAIGLVTNITARAPRYFPANLHELAHFFRLPQADKEGILKLADYLDPRTGEMETVIRDIARAAETDDAFASFVVTQVVLVQWRKDKERMLSALEDIWRDGMERGGSGAAVCAMLDIYWAYLCNTERRLANAEAARTLRRLEEEFIKQTKGVHHYQSGREYVATLLWATLGALENYESFEEAPIARYVYQAVTQRDAQFARDLIYFLGDLAVTYRQCALSLAACVPLLTFQEESIQRELVTCLARIRQFDPYAVDDFLAEHNVPGSFAQLVVASEVGEQENAIYNKALPLSDTLFSRSAYWQQELAGVIHRIGKCKNINQAIIVILKKLISELYGEDIF